MRFAGDALGRSARRPLNKMPWTFVVIRDPSHGRLDKVERDAADVFSLWDDPLAAAAGLARRDGVKLGRGPTGFVCGREHSIGLAEAVEGVPSIRRDNVPHCLERSPRIDGGQERG